MSVIERLLSREGSEPSGIDISKMRKRDLRNGVLAIEERSHPKPWSQSVFASELQQVRSGSRHYLVARRQRNIVGYAGLWFTADEAHVTNVAVELSERRQGIAQALMVSLARQAIERGCEGWTLEVRLSSVGAQELYRTFGFNPVGVRKRYYENVEDAIVMWCHDIQGDSYQDRLRDIETKGASR